MITTRGIVFWRRAGLAAALALAMGGVWTLYAGRAEIAGDSGASAATRAGDATQLHDIGNRTVFPGDAGRQSRPARDPRAIRSLLDIRRAMAFGDFVWDDAGVPAGPMWVRVDLRRQIVSVFRGGDEIATAVVIYGADARPTPLGRFTVLRKERNHHSAAYDAAMPYALFLTRDGVAIHASDVQRRNATHGCIGVPEEFARRLFAVMEPGDPVDVIGAQS
jgi:hypothetical protein